MSIELEEQLEVYTEVVACINDGSGGASGTALSFVHPGEEEMFNKIQQKRAGQSSSLSVEIDIQ